MKIKRYVRIEIRSPWHMARLHITTEVYKGHGRSVKIGVDPMDFVHKEKPVQERHMDS